MPASRLKRSWAWLCLSPGAQLFSLPSLQGMGACWYLGQPKCLIPRGRCFSRPLPTQQPLSSRDAIATHTRNRMHPDTQLVMDLSMRAPPPTPRTHMVPLGSLVTSWLLSLHLHP